MPSRKWRRSSAKELQIATLLERAEGQKLGASLRKLDVRWATELLGQIRDRGADELTPADVESILERYQLHVAASRSGIVSQATSGMTQGVSHRVQNQVDALPISLDRAKRGFRELRRTVDDGVVIRTHPAFRRSLEDDLDGRWGALLSELRRQLSALTIQKRTWLDAAEVIGPLLVDAGVPMPRNISDPVQFGVWVLRTRSTEAANALIVERAKEVHEEMGYEGEPRFLNQGILDSNQSQECFEATLEEPKTVEEWDSWVSSVHRKPGDDRGGPPPRHVLNCRCALVYYPPGLETDPNRGQLSPVWKLNPDGTIERRKIAKVKKPKPLPRKRKPKEPKAPAPAPAPVVEQPKRPKLEVGANGVELPWTAKQTALVAESVETLYQSTRATMLENAERMKTGRVRVKSILKIVSAQDTTLDEERTWTDPEGKEWTFSWFSYVELTSAEEVEAFLGWVKAGGIKSKSRFWLEDLAGQLTEAMEGRNGWLASMDQLEEIQKARVGLKAEIWKLISPRVDEPKKALRLDAVGFDRDPEQRTKLDQAVKFLDDLLPPDSPLRSGGTVPTIVLGGKSDWVRAFQSSWVSREVKTRSTPARYREALELERKKAKQLERGRPSVILVGHNSPVATYAHEVGHSFELTSPAIHRRTLEWFESRVSPDEPVQSLAVLKNDERYRGEMAIKDKFPNPYTGKLYVQAGFEAAPSTEIVSTGLEYLYEDPVAFAKRDPGHFDLMVELLQKDSGRDSEEEWDKLETSFKPYKWRPTK